MNAIEAGCLNYSTENRGRQGVVIGRSAPRERGEWLPGLDDVGGQHAAGPGADVPCVVGCTGWDEEAVTGVQGEVGPPLRWSSACPGEDVADLLTGMGVPAGLHAGGDFGEYLDDLPSGD